MKPGGVLVGTEKGLGSAAVDGDVSITEFNCVEGVPCGLFHFDVPGNRRDSDHTDVRRAKRHDKSDGVIGGGVRVNKEGAWHSSILHQ